MYCGMWAKEVLLVMKLVMLLLYITLNNNSTVTDLNNSCDFVPSSCQSCFFTHIQPSDDSA